MASRMDRYEKKEFINDNSGRSERNKSLYKQIEDLDSYTNIAGVAAIENKNSIDIEKVRQLLKSREEISKENKKNINFEIDDNVIEEEKRNYDINDLLLKAKESGDIEKSKYRSLSTKQQKLLRELNKKNKKTKSEMEQELEELVKTISDMKAVTSEDSMDDDVGLFDDLKADTMVGDASSIKKIIDEEKELTRDFDEMQIDKSFYTASLGFTQKDFEDLKDMNHKIKKDNKFIITLLIILILLVIVGVVFFVIK